MKKLLIGALLLALLPLQAQALDTNELLALVAMPLAVAAVSEVSGVPAGDLASLVTLMNQAEVPPTQFMEVIRYVPAALVVEADDRPFVDYLRQQYLSGVQGGALVTVMADRLREYDVEPDLVRIRRQPQIVVIDRNFIPESVRTVIAQRRGHPHGGPPGQIKKQVGAQTGAEIVHGSRPGRAPSKIRVDSRTSTPSSVVIDTTRNDSKSKGKGQANTGGGKGKGKGKGNN